MAGSTGVLGTYDIEKHLRLKNGLHTATLAGTLTLDESYGNRLRLDPDGSNRNVVLPAEATSNGMWFEILNTAGGSSEDLVVKDDGGNTIVTISQNEKATVECDGTTWYHMGITSIALS